MAQSIISTAAALSILLAAAAPARVQAKDPERRSWGKTPERTLAVTRFVFARRVERRSPVEQANELLADGGRVYAFLELFNKGPARTLTVSWRRDGKAHASFTHEVSRSPRWRTWSYLKATEAMVGDWTVTVADESGKAIASATVTVHQADVEPDC